MKAFNLSINNALTTPHTAGSSLKWTIENGDKTIYIKAPTYNTKTNKWLYDSYSELIVCRLLQELGIDNVLMYYPCRIIFNGYSTIGCYSESFLQPNESYLCLGHIKKHGLEYQYMYKEADGYGRVLGDIQRLTNINFHEELDKILQIDYVILNEDRHFGNIGLIYNYDTQKYKIAPIFDNCKSLYAMNDSNNIDILSVYPNSKTFAKTHEQQLSLIKYPLQITTSIPNTLAYIDSLTKLGLPSNRAQFIKELLITRLQLLHEKVHQ